MPRKRPPLADPAAACRWGPGPARGSGPQLWAGDHSSISMCSTSLDSPPEQLLMRTYCARYAEEGGFDLPALIPQVYLHYDPYTRKSGKQSGALHRQRMDFLLLAPDRSRIVIEVDGVQHYGRKNRPTSTARSPGLRCRGCMRRWLPRTVGSGSLGTRSTASAGTSSPPRAAGSSWRSSSPSSSPGTRGRRCETGASPGLVVRRCRLG